MRSSRTRVAPIRTASRAAPDRPTEDRIFTTPDAVIVLDGASQPGGPAGRSGGWYADVLGREIQGRLDADEGDLAAALAGAITAVAARHNLRHGEGPSATVSIVRWTAVAVDVLVLGDSPVVALTRNGDVREVRDDRLQRVAADQRRAIRYPPGDGADGPEREHAWRSLVDAERAQRNRPGGYWIAEVDPEAAYHSRQTRWDRRDLAALLVMTDGASAGVDRYGILPDWAAAFSLAADEPRRLLDAVHAAEESDPERRRWPRSKRHDDKALALVQLSEP